MPRSWLGAGIAASLALMSLTTASAQPAGDQLVANARAGYQYAVPSDWQTDSTSGIAGALAASPDGSELAYVTEEDAQSMAGDPSATSSKILDGISAGAIGQRSGQTGYQVIQPAMTVTVPGEDTAQSGSVSYSGNTGNTRGPINEYIITAVSGLTGYVLTIDLPANTPGVAGLVASIEQSFALTGSAGSSSGS